MAAGDGSLERLDPDLIRAAVPQGAIVGNQILVFAETDSTNDLAAKAGEDRLSEGLVIFAESQRAGRGTAGRRWISPPGRNLLFSVLLRPPASIPVTRWGELTFCTALAVAETAEAATGCEARIKWPNDVLLARRKVAGILLESHRQSPSGFVVVGIGLNVLQEAVDFDPAIRESAGSLAMAAAGQKAAALRREQVAGMLLGRLDAHYKTWPEDFPGTLAECRRRGCHPPEQTKAAEGR